MVRNEKLLKLISEKLNAEEKLLLYVDGVFETNINEKIYQKLVY